MRKDLSFIPNLPGVYKITNLINGKVYIGKSINLKTRLNGYNCIINSKNTQPIARAAKKYGWENFKFEILEVFPKLTDFIKILILDREAFWIIIYDSLNTEKGYNIIPYGTDCSGRVASEETRRKISIGKKALNQKGENNPNFGKKKSPETLQKMREVNLGKKHTPEAIKNMRGANINKRSVLKLNENGEKINKYQSISEAARSVGGDPSALAKMIKLKRKFKNFLWEFEFPSSGEDKRFKKTYPIYQLDLKTGEIIKEWPSAAAASVKLNILESLIRCVLLGTRNKAGGFSWKKKDEILEIIS